jgi:hypothetical protein
MKVSAPKRYVILTLAGITSAVVASLAAILMFFPGGSSTPPKQVVRKEPSTENLSPSLDCAFHDFTRGRVVVSFYFDVALPKDQKPQFHERAIVAADGTRTAFEGDERRAWTYGVDEDGKQVITSPDGATRVVLYGLKLGASGISTIEAGVRSNEYRNLGGECRQTNLRAGA